MLHLEHRIILNLVTQNNDPYHKLWNNILTTKHKYTREQVLTKRESGGGEGERERERTIL